MASRTILTGTCDRASPEEYPESSLACPTSNMNCISSLQATTSGPTDPMILPNGTTEPTFTIFSDLPIELRLPVWSHARPEPRIVSMWQDQRPNSSPRFICPNQKVLALLYANHESRTEALNKCNLIFSDQLGGRPVYFDFTQGTLLLGDTDVFNHCFGTLGAQGGGNSSHEEQYYHFQKMKFLAIRRCPSLDPSAHISGFTFSDITKFANLQKVTFWDCIGWWNTSDPEFSKPIACPSDIIAGTLTSLRDLWIFNAKRRGQVEFQLPLVTVLSYCDFDNQFCSWKDHQSSRGFAVPRH